MALSDAINRAVRHVPVWPLYAGGMAWLGWLFWRAATDPALIEPVDWLERAYGLAALQLLVASLAISPVRRLAGINLLRFRRATGLLAFAFAAAHVAVWALLDLQAVSAIMADIVKRPYITVGFAAFVLLVPLALTSTDGAIRRMGGVAWRRLHRLVYPAAFLAALHFLWLARGFALEPLVYGGLILILLAARLKPRDWLRRQASRPGGGVTGA